jgi:hypothetical protein
MELLDGSCILQSILHERCMKGKRPAPNNTRTSLPYWIIFQYIPDRKNGIQTKPCKAAYGNLCINISNMAESSQ